MTIEPVHRADSPTFKMYAHIDKPGKELELNILHR